MREITGHSERLKLAQISYKAYGETTNFKNFRGEPMPTWEDLPEKNQEAWYESAFAVYVSCLRSVVVNPSATRKDKNPDLVDQEKQILYQALHLAITRLSEYTKGVPDVQYKKVSEALIDWAVGENIRREQNHPFLKKVILAKIEGQ